MLPHRTDYAYWRRAKGKYILFSKVRSTESETISSPATRISKISFGSQPGRIRLPYSHEGFGGNMSARNYSAMEIDIPREFAEFGCDEGGAKG